MQQYSHNYSVTAADMDTAYRMTPNAVLLYYQDTWARFMGCLRMAAFDVVKQNRMWVIAEFNAWFEQRNAHWGDEIVVTVWNSELTALRVYADFTISLADGTPIAHGYGVWTLLDILAHRLAPLAPFEAQLPVLQRMTTPDHRKERLAPGGEVRQQLIHRVNPINLDFNGHVNNRTYLSIAMQTASAEMTDQLAVRRLTIHWLRETFLGDTLTSRLAETQPGVFLTTISNQDDVPVAQIFAETAPRAAEPDIAEIATRQ